MSSEASRIFGGISGGVGFKPRQKPGLFSQAQAQAAKPTVNTNTPTDGIMVSSQQTDAENSAAIQKRNAVGMSQLVPMDGIMVSSQQTEAQNAAAREARANPYKNYGPYEQMQRRAENRKMDSVTAGNRQLMNEYSQQKAPSSPYSGMYSDNQMTRRGAFGGGW